MSKLQLYDLNVCNFRTDSSHRWIPIITAGQPLLKRTTYGSGRQRVRLEANDNFVAIELPFESDLGLLSINRTNKNNFLEPAGKLGWSMQRYPLFVRGALKNEHIGMLENPKFLQFIEHINLTAEESVHLSSGDLRVYLWRPSVERTLSVIDAGLLFLSHLVSTATEIDLHDLPLQFEALIPLIRSWGISDDVEREERREEAPRASLEAVVAQVKPLLPAINSYLDSFGAEPMPEAATALGALAEFVAETELELQRRN